MALKRSPAPVTVNELARRSGDVTKLLDDRGWGWGPLLGERPIVVAIDPGEAAGGCVISPLGPPPTVSAIKGPLVHTFVVGVEEAIYDARVRLKHGYGSAILVVVEDTHLGSVKKTALAAMAISRYVGAVFALAMRCDLAVMRMPAVSWQSKLLGKGKREQLKKLSIARARQYVSRDVSTDHEADAANMAWFVHMGRRA